MMDGQRLRLVTTAALIALCASLAHAQTSAEGNPKIRSMRSESAADEVLRSQISALNQQWFTAVMSFAHQVGSAVPWNQRNTTTPIAYSPMYLYAGPGGAAACRFAAGTGTPLPTVAGIALSSPVNLAGLTLNLAGEASEQAKAYQAKVGASNVFFPASTAYPMGGTFCAAVAYNTPGPKQFQVSTWFAPSASATQTASGVRKSGALIVADAAQDVANSIASTALGGSAIVHHATSADGNAGQWRALAKSSAAQFFKPASAQFPMPGSVVPRTSGATDD